ncbi:hypothetical protein AX774_g1701 [Zancudomyces culisetae]|uniref:Uncharacterized protein n=1 Tax=Zancudomyces culisetae TaxID=1213189 RepID=A0A1R1PV21_ZANCU|nr:hypothetical protein AX774_g1701 [Zancudomyces culisetae]|eukprot:OMH84769.1 hypothetical protein AX774_g1701 [Zancudomyces culisetae]
MPLSLKQDIFSYFNKLLQTSTTFIQQTGRFILVSTGRFSWISAASSIVVSMIYTYFTVQHMHPLSKSSHSSTNFPSLSAEAIALSIPLAMKNSK